MNGLFEFLKNFDGIIGVIIGAFLTYFMQCLGKLHFSMANCKDELMYEDNDGFVHTDKAENSTLYGYKISFNLNIYNANSNYKSIHDLTLKIYNSNSNELIIKKSLKDEETGHYSGSLYFTDDAKYYNFNPKSFNILKLSSFIGKDIVINKILNKNIICKLEFKNEKNKDIKIEVFKDKILEN